MPVSRKRKKSGKRRSPQQRTAASMAAGLPLYLTDPELHLRNVRARRSALAGDTAAALTRQFVAAAEGASAAELEDTVCARIGSWLAANDDARPDRYIGPDPLLDAVITATVDVVSRALADQAHPDGWRPPWRVLRALAAITPAARWAGAEDPIAVLRARPDGHLLPELGAGPALVGPVRWARDGYGSRFGVLAAFSRDDEASRWYLWDIDTCGYESVTVFSGYFAGPDQAEAAWRAGVGNAALAEATFAPVEDAWLLADLLPADEGLIGIGGEDALQFGEYHRGRRLADEVRVGVLPDVRPAVLHADQAERAAADFAGWLAVNRPDTPRTPEFNELIDSLAVSWSPHGSGVLYRTCSPHRVAFAVEYICDSYHDVDAAEIVALMPDWVAWLSESNATAPDLVKRCLPYALGQPHPSAGADEHGMNLMTRVTE